MENQHYSEELTEWEQIQSPFSDTEFHTKNDSHSSVTIKDDFFSESPEFLPKVHQDLPIALQNNDQHLEEPQPNNLLSSSAGDDGVRSWQKLYLGVLHCGIFQIARGIRKIASFKVDFWSFVLATGGVAAVVLLSLLHRGVLIWKMRLRLGNSKESFMRLIKEKDEKINQLLLQIAQMNEILRARRRVPVIRVK